MRVPSVAALLAFIAPVVGAQLPAPAAGAPTATLTAQLRYINNSDASFSTNKPAYVALFDVTRNGLSQLYPMFSAQATQLSGISGRFDLRAPSQLPTVAVFNASSLVPLSAPPPFTTPSAWPHTLLLVASTSPLRLGSSWTSNIVLNNELLRSHHWNDADSDGGIKDIVALVRPLDPDAEVVFTRVQAATPVQYSASLAYDPNKVALAYSCLDVGRAFLSPTAVAGASCVAVRNLPATGASAAMVTSPAVGADTAKAAPFESRNAAGGRRMSAAAAKHSGDIQSISDPAEIRRFIESTKNQTGEASPAPRAADGTNDAAHRDGSGFDRPADANRRATDGHVSSRLDGSPSANSSQRKPDAATGPRRSLPAASADGGTGPSAPHTAPTPPIKPPDVRQ